MQPNTIAFAFATIFGCLLKCNHFWLPLLSVKVAKFLYFAKDENK